MGWELGLVIVELIYVFVYLFSKFFGYFGG